MSFEKPTRNAQTYLTERARANWVSRPVSLSTLSRNRLSKLVFIHKCEMAAPMATRRLQWKRKATGLDPRTVLRQQIQLYEALLPASLHADWSIVPELQDGN
jgi:hypothetical protein